MAATRTIARLATARRFAAALALALPASAAAAQTAPGAAAGFGLRGAAPAPERRAADLSAGSAAPAPDATINYGKPRKRQRLPKPLPPPPGAKPALPALEPYRTAPQARAQARLRPALAPDAALPPVPPPPTVAVIPTLPVKPRPRVESDPFAPVGIGVGSLRLTPYVETGIGYDANPNRVTTPRTGSAFWRGDVGLAVQSDWSQHSVNGALRLGYSDFFSVPAANRPDGAGSIGARVDVTRDTSIDLGGAFALDTLRPGSPELSGFTTTAASTNRPLVWTISGFGGVTQRFNRLEVSVRGLVDRSQYGDATFSDGTKQYLSQNDYTTVGIRPRVSYDVMPGLAPFVEATIDKRVYDNTADVNGFARSSRGVTLRGGASFEVTRLVRGEVSGGVVQRDYDDPRLTPLRGPVIDAALIWTASPLTTVTLRGSTTVNETTIANVSGAVTRRVSGEIAHALFRNVTLVGTAAFAQTDYRGSASPTTGPIKEDFVQAGVRAEYNLTRTVVVKASYNYERLKSTISGSDYTSNVFLLGLRLQR